MPPLDVRAFETTIGVEVAGLDMSRPPTALEVDTLQEALTESHVLVLRNHRLDPAGQVAFARAFGRLETFAPHPTQLAEHPEIFRVSNQPDDGYLDVGRNWHVDNSNLPEPAALSMLFSVRIPAEGGQTRFMDLHRAYETLSGPLKQRVEGRMAHHEGSSNRGYIGIGARAGGADHPLVRTHPVTGRKALYVNFNLIRSVSGLTAEETQELLAQLRAHLETQPFRSHRWTMGDVVIWDNASTAHMVTPTDPKQHRTLNRLTTISSRPY
jgi:alpha-ketoglutarate-dependent taurine dioxygenase